jgi:hypothetical protein
VDIGQQHPDWMQFLGTLESSSKKIYSGVMNSFIMVYSQAVHNVQEGQQPEILEILKAHFERLHEEKKLDGSPKVAPTRFRSMDSVYLAFWLNTGYYYFEFFHHSYCLQLLLFNL